MEQNLVDVIKDTFHLKNLDPKSYSPLGLAYIGDGIYEIIVRTIVLSDGNMSVNKYHKKSSAMVKASAQAEFYKNIEEHLSDSEMAVFKRGRNAKSGSVAKNANVIDYRVATGVEALFGYLYLDGQGERLLELAKLGLCIGEENES